MTQPKSAGLTLPVRQRHKSTANCRAIATIAFLRAARVARGLLSTGHQRLTNLDSDCQRTIRQASSTNAVRNRTLPCLVIDRSEEHTSELQSLTNLVCRLLLEKKK